MTAGGASERALPEALNGRAARPVRRQPYAYLKPGIFIGALAPLASIAVRATQDALGANPIAQVQNELGLTALVCLVGAMACTPAKLIWGWTWQMRARREIGLFAFFYASLHFVTYLAADLQFDWGTIFEDIAKRPFITVGFAAFVLLIPLAVTSTNDWVKRLGYRRWQRLHWLIYVAGVFAIVHFIWRVKIDLTQPALYGVVLGWLLAVRLFFWVRRRVAAASNAA